MDMSHKKLKLEGPSLTGMNDKPHVMEIVGRGPEAYVWIGEDGRGGKYFGSVPVAKLKDFLK